MCSGRDAYTHLCACCACVCACSVPCSYVCVRVCLYVCMYVLSFFFAVRMTSKCLIRQGLPKPKGAVPCQRGLPRCRFLHCVGAGVCVCMCVCVRVYTLCIRAKRFAAKIFSKMHLQQQLPLCNFSPGQAKWMCVCVYTYTRAFLVAQSLEESSARAF